VDALHADIVHQMMQRGRNLLQLRLDSALADLAELSPAPPWDLRLHVMEHPVHVVQAPSNLGPVALVLFDANVFRRFQDLIGCPIGLGKSGVVLVVVMQVQAQLIRKPLQATGQVIDMRVGTKFDLDRSGRNVAARLVHVLRYIIMIAVVEVVRAMVMVIEVRHYEMPIRVMPIGMVPVEMRIMVTAMMAMVVSMVVVVVILEVNAEPATAKMNADAMSVVVIIVMVIIVMVMLSAYKIRRPQRRQGNRYDL
jgi:hypothetical protein